VHEGEEGHARPGWTTSRREQDSPWKSQSEWQRTGINGESTSMVWPTLGSRTAKEQNRNSRFHRTFLELLVSLTKRTALLVSSCWSAFCHVIDRLNYTRTVYRSVCGAATCSSGTAAGHCRSQWITHRRILSNQQGALGTVCYVAAGTVI